MSPHLFGSIYFYNFCIESLSSRVWTLIWLSDCFVGMFTFVGAQIQLFFKIYHIFPSVLIFRVHAGSFICGTLVLERKFSLPWQNPWQEALSSINITSISLNLAAKLRISKCSEIERYFYEFTFALTKHSLHPPKKACSPKSYLNPSS